MSKAQQQMETVRLQHRIPATLERRLNVYAALKDKKPAEILAQLIETHIPPVPKLVGKTDPTKKS